MTRNRAIAALLLAGAATLTAGCSGNADASTNEASSADAMAVSPEQMCFEAVKAEFNSDADLSGLTADMVPFSHLDTMPANGYFGMGKYNGTNGLRASWNAECIVHPDENGDGEGWAEINNLITLPPY